MIYQYYTFPNGIRLVHRHEAAAVAHCGLFVNAGSRDESDRERGMAHFIEHVIFKGTRRRKVYHIMSRLDNVGGDLNAFTTKEETCVYASFLHEYYERTLELFSDIIFNSVFPEKELEKEKEVIVDEIKSYKDSPGELIFDDFEDLVFHGHPLGYNILGTGSSIKRFKKEDIYRFMDRTYSTDQMLICSVGNIKFEKLLRMVGRYFADKEPKPGKYTRERFTPGPPQRKTIQKRTHQTHTMIGCPAYSFPSEKRIPLALINNLLGGPGLNSRLNLNIREKLGLAYQIESYYNPFSDTGLFCVYAGINNGALADISEQLEIEFGRLQKQKLGSLQLSIAKKQFKGQLAISFESNLSKMMSMGRSMLICNKLIEIKKIYEIIDGITATDIMDIANEILDMDRMSVLTYLSR